MLFDVQLMGKVKHYEYTSELRLTSIIVPKNSRRYKEDVKSGKEMRYFIRCANNYLSMEVFYWCPNATDILKKKRLRVRSAVHMTYLHQNEWYLNIIWEKFKKTRPVMSCYAFSYYRLKPYHILAIDMGRRKSISDIQKSFRRYDYIDKNRNENNLKFV